VTGERARSPLRALRRDPLLVDDRLVAERLRPSGLDPEITRWARAWLVCWHAALVGDERYGRDDPWEIDLQLDGVTLPKGAGDVERRRSVLAALEAGGIATTDDVSGRRGPTVRLTRGVFAEHPAALGIDWETAVTRAGAEPAALLVMRALADLLIPSDALTAVPRRDLIERTGYQQKQVRVAIRRLVAADLVTADGEVGTTARYQFTPRAMGRLWREAPEPATFAPLREPAPQPVPQPAPPAHAPVATAATDGLQLLIGGAMVTIAAGAAFEIGAGVAARLEIGPDGRPRLVVGPGTA
jgi:DNA-binding transcriptional ArsR family regulator